VTRGPSGIKRGLRRQLRAQRDALDVTYRAGCAERATHTIGDHAMWRSALVVASYLPHQSEFDPSFLSRAAIAAGKKLVYPRVVNERLAFHSWRDGDATEATIGGVLQPLASAAPCAIEDIDLFLTPLLGCGTSGIRLGYGGGFYDRLFANAPGFRLGVGFDMQRVADWPVEPHDQRLNGYLIETGLVLFD